MTLSNPVDEDGGRCSSGATLCDIVVFTLGHQSMESGGCVSIALAGLAALGKKGVDWGDSGSGKYGAVV